MDESPYTRAIIPSLVALALLSPVLVAADSPKPAGVVSSLTGRATLTPAVKPQEARDLKFRDDLFFRDRIRTQERSLARVLLGGKAVVTVRALSDLMITEDPGSPSTVELSDGKIGLGVARSQMKPGEAIEIRTPNAVVAVRGTYLVAEVIPAEGGKAASNFYLFEGSAEIFTKDRSRSILLKPLQSIAVTANTLGQVQPIAPQTSTVVLQDLSAPPQHHNTPDALQQEVGVAQMSKAVALLSALGGTLTTDSTQAGTTMTTISPPPTTAINVVTPLTGGTTGTGESTDTVTGGAGGGGTGGGGGGGGGGGTGGGGPPTTINSSQVLAPGQVLLSLSGNFNIPEGPSAVTATEGSSVSGPGTLIQVEAGASGSTAASLLEGHTTTLGTAASPLANGLVVLGNLTSSTNAPLVTLDPTIVNTSGDLLRIGTGGNVTTAGTLFKDVGGTLAISGSLLSVKGTLTGTGNGPLLQLRSTTITQGGSGAVTTFDENPPGTVPVNGLSFKGVTYNFTVGGAASTDAVFGTSVGPGPTDFITPPNLEGDASGVLTLSFSTPTSHLQFGLARVIFSSLTPGGSIILKDSGGSILGSFNLNTNPSLTGAPYAEGLFTYDGTPASSAVLTFPSSDVAPRYALDNLTTGFATGFTVALISLEGSGANVSLAGSLLQASGLSLMTSGPLLSLSGGARLTTGGPILDLTDSTLNFGTQPVVSMTNASTLTTTAGPVFRISGGSLTADELGVTTPGGRFNLTGSLLDLSNTTVTLRTFGETFPHVSDSNDATFTLAAGVPYLQLTSSTLTVAQNTDIGINPQQNGNPFSGVSLIANASTINFGGGVLGIEGPESVTSPTPLIQLTGSTLNATGGEGVINASCCPAAVTLAAPLVSATNSTINTVNPNFNTVIDSTGVGTGPNAVALSRDGQSRFAYVTNQVSNSVSVINTERNTIAATIPVGTTPRGIALTPDGSQAYVTNSGANTVSVIDTTTNTVVATIAGVGTNPSGVAVRGDGSSAYVTNSGSNTVSVINTATNTVVQTVNVGSNPGFIAFSAFAGTLAYVTNANSSTVSVIDTNNNNTVVATIPVGQAPLGVAVSPDGNRVYVANRDSNNVSVINAMNNTVVANIPVGQSPRSVAITPDGSRVYVTNFNSNNVSIIDTAANAVIGTINVGTNPIGVAITPFTPENGTRAIVTNSGANTVSVLDTNPGGNFLTIAGDSFNGTSSITYTGGSPLVQTTGGTITVAGNLVDLSGTNTVTTAVQGNNLTLGTDRPLKGPTLGQTAPIATNLFNFDGTTVTSAQAMQLDTALFEATAPLFQLLGGANQTTTGDYIHLIKNAKMDVNFTQPQFTALVGLTGSTLTVNKGSLFNVAGGSFLKVNGSLFALSNGSTLNINNGALVTVSGGSVFTLTGGSLGLFGPGTNALNITNNVCLSACNIINPIPNLPVLLLNGAVAGNVQVNANFVPFAGLGGSNTRNLGGTSPAVLVVNGSTSKVKLGP